MLDCWLKERLARPNFAHILRLIDSLQQQVKVQSSPMHSSNYDDPFNSTSVVAIDPSAATGNLYD